MRGMNSQTGQPLEGVSHLKQSVADILTTPLGSRVMNPDYGSDLFELIDKPTSPSLIADLIAATVEAINRWEKRLRITQVHVAHSQPGQAILTLEGNYLPNGQAVKLEGIIVQ